MSVLVFDDKTPSQVPRLCWLACCCCSITRSCPTLCNLMLYLLYARLPCLSLSPRVCSNSCPLCRWCHPTISSSITPFSSSLPSFPASGSFPISWLFTSGGPTIGASVSTSVLPMNIQGWFPLELTGLISLHSKGLSRVFSNTTVQKHQFFSLLNGPTLTSVHDWKNHNFDYMDFWW